MVEETFESSFAYGFAGGTSVYDELRNATDAVCAILGAAYLDFGLRQVLESGYPAIRNLKLCDDYHPLYEFGAKIDIARGFGVITENQYKVLSNIRKLRNALAHPDAFDASFENPPPKHAKAVAKALEGLVLQPATAPGYQWFGGGDYQSSNLKNRFCLAVFGLTHLFQAKCGTLFTRPPTTFP